MARFPGNIRYTTSSEPTETRRPTLLGWLRGKDEAGRGAKRAAAARFTVAGLLFVVCGRPLFAAIGAVLAAAGAAAFVANLERRGRPSRSSPSAEGGITQHKTHVDLGGMAPGERFVVKGVIGSDGEVMGIQVTKDASLSRPAPSPSPLAVPHVLPNAVGFALPAMPDETPGSILVRWDEGAVREATLSGTAPAPYPAMPLYSLVAEEATKAAYYTPSWFRDADEEPVTPARPAEYAWFVLDGRFLWPLREWLAWQADLAIDRWQARQGKRGGLA